MKMGIGDITNCKVIVRDLKSGEMLAETVILDYNKTTHVITVNAKYFSENESARVSLLILKDGIIKCMGIIRRQASPLIREIALYKMQAEESRRSTRYTVNTSAKIKHMIVDGQAVERNIPLTVVVENISSSGIMILTSDPFLNVGSSFQLELNISGNRTIIHTSVVRIVSDDGEFRQLGCQFIALCE